MPTPSDTLIIGIFGAGGIAIAALAYKDARLHYRLQYLRWRGDRRFVAGDWSGARRLYEAALAGQDGLKGTPEERRLRLIVEYSLAHVNVRDRRCDEAAKQLDAIEARYTTANDAWVRAYVAYLRAFIADSRGDSTAARRFRQTASSQFKELKKSPELAYLKQYRMHDLARDRRPSEALRFAHEELRSPATTGIARSHAEGIAGYAEQILGSLDKADLHFARELTESGGRKNVPYQAYFVMRRAWNAALAADREASDRFRQLASQMAESEEDDSRLYALMARLYVDVVWNDIPTVQQTLAEIEALPSPATNPGAARTRERALAFGRFSLLTQDTATEAELAEAAELCDFARTADYREPFDDLYLEACALKILALQGNREEFRARIASLETSLEAFLAEREPADAAVLRREYRLLIEASLAAHYWKAAERFLVRYVALPIYPIDAPRIAVWQERICQACSDKTTDDTK